MKDFINVKSSTSSKMIRFLFLIGIFLSPFIYWMPSPLPYEIPRVIYIIAWIELLGIISLFCVLTKPPNVIRDQKISILIISFFIIAVFSSLLGSNLIKSIWGNYYRIDGLFTLSHLIGLYLIVSLFWHQSWKIPVCIAVTLGAFGLSLWSIICFGRNMINTNLNISNLTPIGISFGQPNFLAGYLLVTFPFIYFLQKNYRKTQINLLIIGLCVTFAICLTQSIVGLLLAILWWIGVIVIKGKKSLLISGLMAVVVIAIVSAIFFKSQTQKKFSWDYHPESRKRIMIKTFLGAMTRPLQGFGYANVDSAFNKIPYPFPVDVDVYVDKAHNQLLEVFATSGIVGLTVYLLIIINLLISLNKQYRFSKFPKWQIMLFSVLLIYLVHSQTNVISIAEEIWFWIIAGIITAETTVNTPHLSTSKKV